VSLRIECVSKFRVFAMPLSAADVAKLLKTGAPAKEADGRSLYLVVKAPNVGVWKGQYRDGVSFRTKSLGGAPAVKLADARASWELFKAERRKASPDRAMHIAPTFPASKPRKPVPTGRPFGEAVAEYVTAKSAEWRGGIGGKTARLYMADARAIMPGGRPLATYTWPELTDDVIAAYVAKMSVRAAKDTTDRLQAVRGYMERGTVKMKAPEVEHHDAMPWQDVPQFYSELALTDERARALAFVILTAVRVGDALGTKDKAPATWCEIEGEAWNVPGERTKNGEPHTVPLTPAMLALLGDRKAPAAPLFGVGYFQVNRLLKKLRPADADIHGFRASFRTWMQDKSFDREAAEMCLQHKIGNAAELAYKRSALLSQRREIMQVWTNHVTGRTGKSA
jgi:integrase